MLYIYNAIIVFSV